MLTARLAEFVSREDALASREQGVQQALAEILSARRELEERLAAVVERETTLARQEQEQRGASPDLDAEQTLARAGKLRADLAKELAEFTRAEEARRQAAPPASEGQRRTEPSQPVADAAVDRDDVRRLTELVKNTARQEAETVLKKAHEEAALIREQAKAERETQ